MPGRGQVCVDAAARDVALVIDLDGTLVRTDTLHESLLGLISASPGAAMGLPFWLRGGRAGFKARVADCHMPDVAHLPMNPAVLRLIEEARAAGRTVALVSGADRRVVEAVAGHLGIFDVVAGSQGDGGTRNLSGTAKARWLTDRFGARGFDYVGDSLADLPVWRAARRGFAVGPAARVARLAAAANVPLEPVLPAGASRPAAPRTLLRAMRPHQWAKNALILLPALAGHRVEALGPALIATASFCAAASSVYLMNDLLDLSADRAHPRKRHRPFAAGELPLATGVVAAAGLVLLALALAVLLPRAFLGVLVAYMAGTMAYSLWLKRKLLIDIITLAVLYTVRILAGAAATGIALSPWLLAFSMFVFFSLAAVKRMAELVDMQGRGLSAVRGRGYRAEDLDVMRVMAVSSGQAAVLVFALYISSPRTARLYGRPELLWLICPVLFFWLSRMVLMTQRGNMGDDPVVFAFRDRHSRLSILLILVIAIVATIGWPA